MREIKRFHCTSFHNIDLGNVPVMDQTIKGEYVLFSDLPPLPNSIEVEGLGIISGHIPSLLFAADDYQTTASAFAYLRRLVQWAKEEDHGSGSAAWPDA